MEKGEKRRYAIVFARAHQPGGDRKDADAYFVDATDPIAALDSARADENLRGVRKNDLMEIFEVGSLRSEGS